MEEVAAGPWQPVSTLGSVSRLCPHSRVSPKQQGKQPLLPDTAAPEHQHICPAPCLSQAQEGTSLVLFLQWLPSSGLVQLPIFFSYEAEVFPLIAV